MQCGTTCTQLCIGHALLAHIKQTGTLPKELDACSGFKSCWINFVDEQDWDSTANVQAPTSQTNSPLSNSTVHHSSQMSPFALAQYTLFLCDQFNPDVIKADIFHEILTHIPMMLLNLCHCHLFSAHGECPLSEPFSKSYS
jgi:hypothetical protein